MIYDGVDHPVWMYDRDQGFTVTFELDTMGNVRRLHGGRKVTTDGVEPQADMGGYRYTAFGKAITDDPETPAPEAVAGTVYDQPIRWQGRWYLGDDLGGLYDFRARAWSPELGAFLQADRIEFLEGAGTLWSWPHQNPLKWRDPSGRVANFVIGGIIGGIVGGIADATVQYVTTGTVDLSDVAVAVGAGALTGAATSGIASLAVAGHAMKIGLGALTGAEIAVAREVVQGAVNEAQGEPQKEPNFLAAAIFGALGGGNKGFWPWFGEASAYCR